MTKRPFAALWLTVALCAPSLVGCKEDPPPPTPDPPAAGSSKPDPFHTKLPTGLRGTQIPRISPETMKIYRIDTCLFGTMGLLLARENYMASLGGAEPGPDKLPSFGEFPTVQPPPEPASSSAPTTPGGAPAPSAKVPGGGPAGSAHAGPGRKRVPGGHDMEGGRRMAGRGRMGHRMGSLPFVRHIRSCSVAKTLKTPPFADLDGKLASFEEYVNELNKVMLDTTRYYARNQQTKDDFKKGKELHKQLMDLFPKLDEQLANFAAAVAEWYPNKPAEPEKLDEAGEIATKAVEQARQLTLLLTAASIDGDKVKELADQLKPNVAKLDEMRHLKVPPPHSRIVGPKLQVFEVVLDEIGSSNKLTPVQRYELTYTMADVIEANQRGLAQLLRKRGDTMPAQRDPSRLIKPKMKTAVPLPGKEDQAAKPAP